MVVGPLDEDGARAGVADVLHKGELVVSEGLLMNLPAERNGWGRVGSGRVGSGRVGSGRIGSGRVGLG